MLTQTLLNELFTYSDGNIYWKVQANNRIKVGDLVKAEDGLGYLRVSVFGKRYKAHSIIYCMHHGYIPKMIDHINRNTRDNRIENLRECAVDTNAMNSKKRSDNTSGYKNVMWIKDKNKWIVRFTLKGKQHTFGMYDNIEDAAEVANEVRKELHGEFANNG